MAIQFNLFEKTFDYTPIDLPSDFVPLNLNLDVNSKISTKIIKNISNLEINKVYLGKSTESKIEIYILPLNQNNSLVIVKNEEGTKSDGTRSEGTLGTKSEGTKSEGTKSKETLTGNYTINFAKYLNANNENISISCDKRRISSSVTSRVSSSVTSSLSSSLTSSIIKSKLKNQNEVKNKIHSIDYNFKFKLD